MNTTPESRLLELYDRVAEAPDAIDRLRKFVLDLAVRGKLVEQHPEDEPAEELLERIAAEKARRVKAGTLKAERKSKGLSSPVGLFALPKGWTWTSLQSICMSISDGDHQAPPKSETGIPFLVIGDVRTKLINYDAERRVPQEYYDTLDPIRRPQSGDLLYTLVGSFGIPVPVRSEAPFCIQRHIGILRPAQKINLNCLALFLESEFAFKQAEAVATGIAQKTVSLAGLRSMVLPLPPLPEQRRIVAKVDELMALLDRLETTRTQRETTRDRLTTASLTRLTAPDTTENDFPGSARFALDNLDQLTSRPDQIKVLRQTILNLAVQGKLVEQDPADESAEELLKRITAKLGVQKNGGGRNPQPLSDVDLSDAPFKLPTGWTWARFPELGTFGRGKSKHRPRNDPALYKDGTYPMVQTGDVARSGGTITTNTAKYNDDGLAQSLMWPKGTLCITIAANIADSGILDFDACFPDSVVGFVPNSEFESARYFEYFLRTAKANLMDFAPATAQKNINLGILSSLLIPLPPLAEQIRIVEKVDFLMSLFDQLEAFLTTANITRARLLEARLHQSLKASSNRLEAA